MSMQTKEMQPEVRHDALEDKVDSHNYQKNVGVGKLLDWRLKLALEEREVQDKAFEDIDAMLKDELCLEEGSFSNKPVYGEAEEESFAVTVTEAEVKLKLRQEELAELAKGAQLMKGRSMTAFLTMGLELEDAQWRIVAQTRESTLTLNGESSVHERRLAFFKKVKIFRGLQRSYMPGVKGMIEEADAKRDPEEPAPQAEEIALWLPSHVPEHERVSMCDANLFDMEYKLREGHDKIDAVAMKYRMAQNALKTLQGENSCGWFRVLQKDDVAPVQEAEIDDKAKRKLGRLGGRDSRSQKTKVSKKNMSWIWTEAGGPDEDESDFLHESVRVEWSKAWARRERWREEVKLLCEEMRRVL
ncbi:hypothetical protein EV421DRAFT_1745077 [Armillaria borealis]|uniref:Uncharacterized protein n=1 Tax=Armillaria borealis TaxID=47425 RepID=A0AA39MDK1_9AGAR|nr:hypothetical protein EV421DRAFT_1745077 [Armillaria borealis]